MGPRWIESSSPMKYSCPLSPPELIKPLAVAINSQEVQRDDRGVCGKTTRGSDQQNPGCGTVSR